MKKIFKYNVLNNKMEEVTLFTSPLLDKITELIDPLNVGELKLNKGMIKVCAECGKNSADEAIIKSQLAHMTSNGFMFNGVKYVPFMAGASDARKATSTWVNEDIVPELGKWAMCGLQTKHMKLAINKYMAYVALLSSASKPFAEVFGKDIDICRVAIIDDINVEVDAIVDFVAATTGVEHDKACKVAICAFDGFGIIRSDITNGESVTIRGPWLKAFTQAIDFKKLYSWCVANKVKAEFKDLWGNIRKLKDVDMILTKSCFKTAGLYESWEKYCSAFEELGHHISVCVREHAPKLKGLPYQQGQTLLGNEEDIEQFVAHAKETVDRYTLPFEAATLLRGAHKQAVKMYPAMLNEPFTKRTVQDMYTTKRNDMLGGRIPELGYNAFLAPDPVAFAQHIFGLPITGFLKAGECYCKPAKTGFVDVTRNPHFDNAHVVLNNVKFCPLSEGPTMFINIFDMTTIRLRADYDGDHVWYSQDDHLLDLVNRTYKQIKNIPIDWDAPKAEKVNITKSGIAAFITNLIHGSEIGLYADALTKMWNIGYDRDVCNWLTYAGNVLIDAAKHGNVKIKKPEAVSKLNTESLPLYAMYAKADADRPVGSDHWLASRMTKNGGELPPRCAYSGSFLDKYSKMIDESVPETLEIYGVDDMIFDPTILMIEPRRPMTGLSGLWKRGTFNPEDKTFVDCGLFQTIAFRHSTEWNNLIKDKSFFTIRKEWEDEVGRMSRQEIIDWSRKNDPENANKTDEELDDACYDIIARFAFTAKMSDGMDTVIKQAFWRIYGAKAVSVMKANLSVSAPDDDEDDDELFDVEFEDNLD